MDEEFDIVIAGGGIAGLTAALTAARLGCKTFVLSGDVLGGLLLSIEKVEGFPGFVEGVPGYDLCPMIQEQAVAAGAQFTAASLDGLDRQNGGWQLTSGSSEVRARAVILATGATLKELGVPGEERLRGKGVSHCASCDAPLVRKQTVAVVGGGDSALQEALTLAEFAERVIILQRGDDLTAQAVYCDRAASHPKIEICLDTVVEEVLGDGKMGGVRIRSVKGNASSDLELAAIFIYIGLEPATTFVKAHMKLDPSGRIPVDAQMRTELPGIFAAGIARSGSVGRAVASAGDGTLRRSRRSGIWRTAIGRVVRRTWKSEVPMSELLTVHDPRGYPPKVAGKRLASRSQSLDGKVVYLVDCLFDNSAAFMDQLQQWFAAHLPAVDDTRHQAARKLGGRSRHARRRSLPTATPRYSVSGFEAPVARRSSG